MPHTSTTTLAEMEGISATLRKQMASANEQQAAMVAVVEAGRVILESIRPQMVNLHRIRDDVLYVQLELAVDDIRGLHVTLTRLDALTPDPAEDDTRELQAVEPELPPRPYVSGTASTREFPTFPGSYKRARGILAPADEPAEVSIRRMRDGGEASDAG